jgi:sulfhydrogenase subunit beta (sulfur reductase)
MRVLFIRDDDFGPFVTALIAAGPVFGPVARRSKFVFGRLEAASDLRLDYDVTVLPPKKLFFPPAQDLIRFDGDRFSSSVEPEQKVLLGVHPYDVRAMDITDLLFSERHADVNYLAHRETTTVVGSNVQTVAPRAFWASIGGERAPTGHDAFLTRITGGFLYAALTPDGEALLLHGVFAPATPAHADEAARVDAAVKAQCPERLSHPEGAVAETLRAAFGNERLWDDLAADCFSCGSCNIVCPTCYCFDVQDWWQVDQKSGGRSRYWDACLTEEFAMISLAGGRSENFRETRGDRFRHRIMRKMAYLNAKLGSPACVGCGRCSTACTADIADPVAAVDRIMPSREP